MAINDLTTEFSSAIDVVFKKVTGLNSIYDKTLIKLSDLYISLGMSMEARDKAIAEVSAQLAVSSTNAAISAAADMAKNARIIDAQVLTEGARKALIDKQVLTEVQKALMVTRQIKGFNDKLLVEVMKAMGGVSSMEATNGSTTIGTLTELKAKITAVESAAGVIVV